MNIRNLKYNSLGAVDCEIEHPVYGWIPFTASPDDCEEYGRKIYQEAVEGKLGEIAPYIPPPPPTDEQLATEARTKRNQLLADSDWTQLPDARNAMGVDKAAEWDTYRQALRDITEQEGFPREIEWPIKPE